MKCKHCQKEINKNEAYKKTKTYRSGKRKIEYYCDEKCSKEIEMYKLFDKEIRQLLELKEGYVGRYLSKEMAMLSEKYSYADMYKCLDEERLNLMKIIALKNFDNDFGKTKYIMVVLEYKLKEMQ
jgi:hypothetical protein